ncbi:MAG: ABC transporter ATP-binding protein [Eubacteriales bacterium]
MCKIIELRDVSYCYPNSGKPSLKNVTFSAEKGTFVAIMGPTGAGKTTLNLCLNGLIPQLLEGDFTGNITVAGQDLSLNGVQSMVKHIGLVLDDPETQIFGRTVQEDTAFGPVNLSLPAEEIYRRVVEALNRVGLKGYEERDTSGLSGGEQQRLAIAGVLAMQPEVLVLDEPASELDPVGRTEIYKTIDDLRLAKRLTILVTEHYGEEISKRADLVIVFNRGEIVWQGVPEELFRNISLLDRFGIRPVPVSLVGWDFYQKGWITLDEIPLDVPSAEKMVRNVLSKHILRDSLSSFKPESFRRPDTKAPAVLQVSNLLYQYTPDIIALQSVNLTIRRGEFVALIGRNGSGKTTLTKHFNGLLKPTDGEVVVDGMNTKKFNTSILAQVVGYVFQNPDHQIFSNSLERELAYGLKNAGLDDAEIKLRVDNALKLTGLEQQRNDHPFSLGKGERQKVAVASILALEPKILVIDEPTTGQDWAGMQNMMALIKQLHENGTTVIMISHDMEIVAKCAQRVIVMKDGGILLEGSTREVFENFEMLEQAGIVPPQIVRLTARLKDLGFEDTFLNEKEFAETISQVLEASSC